MVKRKPYDPRTYWDARAKDYALEQKSIYDQLAYLINMIRKGDSILDVGSGNGRVYKFFENCMVECEYTMCDISPMMIDACESHTGKRPDLWNGMQLPYDCKEFDYSFLFYVLQHSQAPNTILREVNRVTKKNVIVLDSAVVKPNHSKHCFHHDWLLSFYQSNLIVEDCKVFGNSILWTLVSIDENTTT